MPRPSCSCQTVARRTVVVNMTDLRDRYEPPASEPAGRRRPPVMHDVAAMAGVSHQTVSRVINGSPQIRPETRRRVERAIELLGYRPNTAARALVKGRSGIIGVI